MTYALFSDHAQADSAVRALRNLGASDAAISVINAERLHDAADAAGAVKAGRGRGAGAPSTDPDHATPITGEPGEARDPKIVRDANRNEATAAGLGVAAVLTSLVVPGLGIVLGGGALATGLAGMLSKRSGPSRRPPELQEYLATQNLSDQATGLIGETLDSGGSLLQIDPTKTADPSEGQILQAISEHGGRIAWDLGSVSTHADSVASPSMPQSSITS